MKSKKINITKLKAHANNPRLIDEHKMDVLMKSIQDFPKMLELRPIIVDENFTILCGNMRYRACLHLNFTTVPCIQIKDLSKEKKEELLIKDNLNYGEWDDEMMEDVFNVTDIEDWTGEVRVDYSFLDNIDFSNQEKADRVVKSIAFHLPNRFYEIKEMERRLRDENKIPSEVLMEAFKDKLQEIE